MTAPPPTALAPASDRIVVGVDGSESSRQALRWAQYLANATDGTIVVVTAWQPFITFGGVGAGWTVMPTDWNPVADAEKAAVAAIDEVFGADRPTTLHVTVREGNAARVLLDLSQGARMLIVGSRGHGGFAGLLLGSVSAACSEHATCPVLVVHGTTPQPTRTDAPS